MPKLIRLYILHCAIGFAISIVFFALLMWLDVAGLRGLILRSDLGWLAALMLIVLNGTVFAGVQFAIAVMRLADADSGPRGGKPTRLVVQPVRQVAGPQQP